MSTAKAVDLVTFASHRRASHGSTASHEPPNGHANGLHDGHELGIHGRGLAPSSSRDGPFAPSPTAEQHPYGGGARLDRLASLRSLDPEQSAPTPPSRSPAPEDNAPPPPEEVSALRMGAHYAVLVLAAMIGTLIRLGLDAMGTYDGAVIFPTAWAQGVGCGIMGLALAHKNQIVWIYPPLYTFITTGIAGSVTTFSTWMLEGYLAFANFDGYSRSGFYDTVNGLAYSFATMTISIACLYLGGHMSRVLRSLPRPQQRHPAVKHRAPLLDTLALFSSAVAYLIALLLYFLAPHHSWRYRALFPVLMAPPGAMLRFWLAKLNTRAAFLDRFPMGTFIANMVASILIAGVFAAQRLPSSVASTSPTRCDALYAVQQGFCGCLSTVSTFAVEARAIRKRRWNWAYVLGSTVAGHVLVMAVVGGVHWGGATYGPLCQGSDGAVVGNAAEYMASLVVPR